MSEEGDWDTFWLKVPNGHHARPMCDSLRAFFGRLPEQASPSVWKVEGETFHAIWDNGKCLFWVTLMENGKWEWFFRDREKNEHSGSPDGVYVGSSDEMTEVARPYLGRLMK